MSSLSPLIKRQRLIKSHEGTGDINQDKYSLKEY